MAKGSGLQRRVCAQARELYCKAGSVVKGCKKRRCRFCADPTVNQAALEAPRKPFDPRGPPEETPARPLWGTPGFPAGVLSLLQSSTTELCARNI